MSITLGKAKGKDDLQLEALVDTDRAGEHGNRKSVKGYLVKLYGSCISWGSIKQSMIALPTPEAEYVAMSMCVRALARL